MKSNIFLKVLSSLPIILLTLYFIPFLGICLILLRCFINNKKSISTLVYIVCVGILLLIPKGLNLIFNMTKVDLSTIPYLKNIVNAELYNVEFISYSKRLICIGVILLIVLFALKGLIDKVSSKLNNGIRNYIDETQRRNAEISRKNDMEIKIKQEKAKNTSYVKCPNCGSDNLLEKKFGICKYCRSKLENKNYKS